MKFPGVWATKSRSAAFRVVPKCACSTVGQVLFFSEYGHYYEGDIHRMDCGLLKWEIPEHRVGIAETVISRDVPTFTCVRNPYSRILSAFFDKIVGIESDGSRYRGDHLPTWMKKYGVDLDGDFDQIRSFRRFLLFVRDTIKFKSPFEPDIHWAPIHWHLQDLVRNGGRYDAIMTTEELAADIGRVFSGIQSPCPIDPAAIPRFNEGGGETSGPAQAHPVEAYFDDTAVFLMTEVYGKDFELFNYDKAPGSGKPLNRIDVDKVNRRLGG